MMAEVIGAISGLLGICDVIIRSSSRIAKYITDAKDYPKEIGLVKSEIENLEAITAATKGFLTSSKATSQKLDESATIFVVLRQCQGIVGDVERYIIRIEASSAKRLRWAFIDIEKVKSFLQNLDRFTAMLHLALSLDGWSMFFKAATEAASDMTRVREDVQRVIKHIRGLESLRSDVAEMERYKRTIEEAMAFCRLAMSKRTAVDDSLLKLQETLQRQEDDTRRKRLRSEKKIAVEFFSTADLRSRQQYFSTSRHAGTSVWITERLEFKEWISGLQILRPSGRFASNGAPKTLWCHGIPGCGKSVMFSAVVDHLMRQNDAEDFTVAWIYLTHDEPALHASHDILAALLAQVVESLYETPGVEELVSQLKKSCEQPEKRKPTAEECISLLQQLSSEFRALILCFDGLDEIPDSCQQALVRFLASMEDVPQIRLLIMSRDSVNLRGLSHIDIPVSAKNKDIELFLSARLDAILPDIPCYESDKAAAQIKTEVISAILQGSSGMFLMASLQVQQLEAATSVRDVRDITRSLPQALDDQYHSYLHRVFTRRHKKLAIHALRWIYSSYRALSAEELLEALSVIPGDCNFDASGMTSIETLLKATGGLVLFDQNSKSLRLVHHTLQDFLDRHSTILGCSQEFALERIATYLHFEEFDRTPMPRSWVEVDLLRSRYKFLDYAFRYWGHYVHGKYPSTVHLGRRIAERIATCNSLTGQINCLGAMQFLNIRAENFTSLHVSAAWKVREVSLDIISCIRKSPGTLVSGNHSGTGLTPLHVSAVVGDAVGVSLLLNHGELPAVRDERGRTPAYYAAAGGHFPCLEALLSSAKKPVEWLRIGDQDQVNPLHVALLKGHSLCSKLLLSYGADPNAVTSSGQTALHYALQFCPDAIEQVLSAGASVNALLRNRRTALHCACTNGVALELAREAIKCLNPNDVDERGETPLHLIVQADKELVSDVEWLLDLGADPNSQNEDGMTPLHIALDHGFFLIARRLLSRGALTDLATKDGTLPIFVASRRQCPQSLLMDLMTPNGSMPTNGNSFLHLAVMRQNSDEVNGLLLCHAPVNALNADGETPLHLAVRLFTQRRRYSSNRKVRSDIVSLLVHHEDIQPSIMSVAGYTPLHIALAKLSEPLLSLLVPSCSEESVFAPSLPSLGLDLPQLTPVAYAALYCSPTCLDLLLRKVSRNMDEDMDHDQEILALINELSCQLLGSGQSLSTEKLEMVKQRHIQALALAPPMETLGSEPGSCTLWWGHNGTCREFTSLTDKIHLLLRSGPGQRALHDDDPRGAFDRLYSWCRSTLSALEDWVKATGLGDDSQDTAAISSSCKDQLQTLLSVLDCEARGLDILDHGQNPGQYTWDDSIPLSAMGAVITSRPRAGTVSSQRNMLRVEDERPTLSPLSRPRSLTVGERVLSSRQLKEYDGKRRNAIGRRGGFSVAQPSRCLSLVLED